VSLGLSTPNAEPGRRPIKRDLKKNTFEAGMCMKKNKYVTICPKKSDIYVLDSDILGKLTRILQKNSGYNG
jgi:hypothetical protein